MLTQHTVDLTHNLKVLLNGSNAHPVGSVHNLKILLNAHLICMLFSSIEQDVLDIGSNGQEMLRTGSYTQFGMNERDILKSENYPGFVSQCTLLEGMMGGVRS